MCDNLLLFGIRIVVPTSKIHQDHQGFQKCRLRISTSVWWLGVTQNLERFIKECPTYQQTTPPQKEPLLPTPLPDHPWEKLATDLFHHNGINYILLIDYYCWYVEVQKLSNTTSAGVISFLKVVFSHHGIPVTLMRQWSTIQFKKVQRFRYYLLLSTHKFKPTFSTIQ